MIGKKPPEYLIIPYADRHRHVVMSVDERDKFGRPRKLTLIHQDEKIDIRLHREMITAYIPECNVIKE